MDPFVPRVPYVNPPATPAPSDLMLGPVGRILPPDPIGISIFIHYNSFPPRLNPWLHIPAIPSTTIARTPSTPPVHPLHLHITNMMCPRMHQKLFGWDTSIPHTTHFYPSFELPEPLPHYVCIRFVSHKHPALPFHNSPFPSIHTTNHSLFYLKTTMPARSARSTRKTTPEAAAPYPPFGRHPSDPLEICRSALPPTDPQPMPCDQPTAAPTTKPSSRSKSVSTVPQAKTICPRGRSAAPTKATYPIFLNDASTTTTSSLTLGSSNVPFQQRHASLTTSRN
jgi:hypothetical protein